MFDIDVRRTAADPLGSLRPSGTPGPRASHFSFLLDDFGARCQGGKPAVKDLLASPLLYNLLQILYIYVRGPTGGRYPTRSTAEGSADFMADA